MKRDLKWAIARMKEGKKTTDGKDIYFLENEQFYTNAKVPIFNIEVKLDNLNCWEIVEEKIIPLSEKTYNAEIGEYTDYGFTSTNSQPSKTYSCVKINKSSNGNLIKKEDVKEAVNKLWASASRKWYIGSERDLQEFKKDLKEIFGDLV